MWLALKLRTNREQPKYLAISGGHPCLFGADTLVAGEPAILAEGEFDTMLLWQEAGDLISMATLGSCNRGVSVKALRYLLGCPRLLVAFDVDAEGEKGAERLRQLSPRMRRIRPPMSKDVTAFWQTSGCVRDWVRFELARLERRLAERGWKAEVRVTTPLADSDSAPSEGSHVRRVLVVNVALYISEIFDLSEHPILVR